MYSLGIHDGHNSSACLMQDGRIVYAVQEERFSRVKNFWGPPVESVKACLSYAGIGLAGVQEIAFAGHDHPTRSSISRDDYTRYTRSMLSAQNPRAFLSRVLDRARSMFSKPEYDLQRRLGFYANVGLDEFPREAIWTVRHHDCHFATAAFGSGNGRDHDLLVITVDGYGDGENATVSTLDKDGEIRRHHVSPDTLPFAKLYAWVTVYLGFIHLEHEYKLMGMAPYANPARARKVADKFSALAPYSEGRWSYWRGAMKPEVDDHLIYRDIRRICEFERFDDVCGGLQLFCEELILKFVEHWVEKTGVRHVALSGGFFMNVKANQLLRGSAHIQSIYVFPSCGDESNAIGAVMFRHFTATGRRPVPIAELTLGDPIGEVSIDEIRKLGADAGALKVSRFEDIESEIARLLASGEIVARVKGREEFGARALGNRSILANPSDWRTVQVINDMIKSRDFWMPFAASILDADAPRYLSEYSEEYQAHYMIMTYDSINTADIMAATHPKDRTVRPQVVTREFNPDYYRLIEEFRKLTGIGAVLNTSFNLHGYPLVHSVRDAVDVLLRSGLKYLAIGNLLLDRTGSAPSGTS